MNDKIISHQKAYVCIHVYNGSDPVLLVSRPEGDWCFLCGAPHQNSASEYRVVGIGHIFEKDPTLLEIIDLQNDWEAERTAVGGSWIRTTIFPNA